MLHTSNFVSSFQVMKDPKSHSFFWPFYSQDFERIFDELLKNCEQLLAFKFGLVVGDDAMFDFVVNQMKTLEVR